MVNYKNKRQAKWGDTAPLQRLLTHNYLMF